ncbi:glycosyltransferase family 2 protein [Aestuariispira insulae]|uniref:Glycosyltransferase involved in cell wall biosynthesis n=1 Tax=Aestuariispira insulae TaxID=1461337 RepID=A0A3D9HEV1_9PROT|nr:glycosyltransferase family 2 protein [Aestuariispira insulae]RED48010.1 glycosyltransferase involved in cell wall biosynthesis [Aestuariispira insulae]
MDKPLEQCRVAVLLPCYNEEGAIGKVVQQFRTVLPNAQIYVFDNNSKDNSVEEARAAGAVVRREGMQGKGYVVRSMFVQIDADYYLMADGDATYDAESAPKLLSALHDDGVDMVVGCRESVEGQETYRSGHRFGNWALTSTARYFFGRGFTDMLSGYRGFSRRFVKSFPVMSAGFEIETEMTIHALSLNLPTKEIVTPYFERAEGTESKLSTYRDGWRILMTMVRLFKDYRPMAFFSIIALILAMISGLTALPVILEYLETGLVPRIPTAILASGIGICALLSLTSGFILDSVAKQRLEMKRLAHLTISSQG